MPNVIHFEICADDVERAASFYSKIFGWKIERAEGSNDYWIITTGSDEDPGITGGLMKRFDQMDSIINTIDVPSLDAFAKRITEAGGKVLKPKAPIVGLGYYQYCRDLEGNPFAIMEFDESAE